MAACRAGMGRNPPSQPRKAPNKIAATTEPTVNITGPAKKVFRHESEPPPHGDAIAWIELVPHGEYVASQPATPAIMAVAMSSTP